MVSRKVYQDLLNKELRLSQNFKKLHPGTASYPRNPYTAYAQHHRCRGNFSGSLYSAQASYGLQVIIERKPFVAGVDSAGRAGHWETELPRPQSCVEVLSKMRNAVFSGAGYRTRNETVVSCTEVVTHLTVESGGVGLLGIFPIFRVGPP